MLKRLFADKDTYVTDKVIRGRRMTTSNVGAAATLDLFKLVGATYSGSTPNVETSRLLVHFDLDPIRQLVSEGRLSLDDPSLRCRLRLRDVYGGQPTPDRFTVVVHPLSSSFDEGIGRDVAYFSDRDSANWLSSSYATTWVGPGAGSACDASLGGGDYITSSLSIVDTSASQFFVTGDENLTVDVTSLVSATLVGQIPDAGFRISFDKSHEDDGLTYFVKRFASRTAYDETKRPSMLVSFDDSVSDDTQSATFDATGSIGLYNSVAGAPANVVSGSSLVPIVGTNCMVLRLTAPVSGGSATFLFSGSQRSRGTGFVVGEYASTFLVPSADPQVSASLISSSSLTFTPRWTSLDGSVTYATGEPFSVSVPTRSSAAGRKNFVVSVRDVRPSYTTDERIHALVHIFDQSSPFVTVTRLPVELPGVVLRRVYYQVRDAVTDEVVVPFDAVTDSTRVSSDSDGMFFDMDADVLTPGRTYVVDVMVDHFGEKTRYPAASPAFRIELPVTQ